MDIKEKRRLILVTVVIILLLSVSGLHFFTTVHQVVYHDFYDRLYYLPIILSAFFFGIRGGGLAALAAGVLFFAHLKFQWGMSAEMGRYLEIPLYLVVGMVTGILSDLEKKSRQKTEDAYAKLRDSFEKAKEAARLAAIGKVSAGVAHEIRNPLGGMKGAMEAIASELKPDDTKVRFVKIVEKEISRINRIVEDFLNFAKPREPDLAPADLNSLLQGVLDLHRDIIMKKKISLAFHPDAGLPVSLLDPNQIQQVFLNVLLNSVDFMPGGGALEILSRRSGGALEVVISDTGVGINPEDEEQLFEPFFTTRTHGTGMGLAISRQIMQRHGGRISIKNRTDGEKGAVVVISLPPREPEKEKDA